MASDRFPVWYVIARLCLPHVISRECCPAQNRAAPSLPANIPQDCRPRPSGRRRRTDWVFQNKQRMVPAVAGIVYALVSRCSEGPIGRGDMRIRADDDQPVLAVQGHEQLTSKRMALHQPDRDRRRPGGGDKPTDVDLSAFRGDVDRGEIVEAPGKAFVDRQGRQPIRIDDLAKRRKCLPR